MPLLILGGTADGRQLAEKLYAKGVDVIYSVAGLVRLPNVSCKVISGGFRQFGGLESYIKQNNISAVLDVTHPYAEKMSTTAVAAAKHSHIPCWRFHRPTWQQTPEDQWHFFSSWPSLLQATQNKKRLFLTVGQVDQALLSTLSEHKELVLLRTAVEPKLTMPENVFWIKAIGPFNTADEKMLMQLHGIDALLSKNSGGDSTVAKLTAARELNIEVYLLERPALPAVEKSFTTQELCESFVLEFYNDLEK